MFVYICYCRTLPTFDNQLSSPASIIASVAFNTTPLLRKNLRQERKHGHGSEGDRPAAPCQLRVPSRFLRRVNILCDKVFLQYAAPRSALCPHSPVQFRIDPEEKKFFFYFHNCIRGCSFAGQLLREIKFHFVKDFSDLCISFFRQCCQGNGKRSENMVTIFGIRDKENTENDK